MSSRVGREFEAGAFQCKSTRMEGLEIRIWLLLSLGCLQDLCRFLFLRGLETALLFHADLLRVV